MSADEQVAGVLLAAGAGRRMGMPKALVRTGSGEAWVVRGARVLLDSGCSPVVVVVGAAADSVSEVLAVAFGDESRLRVVRARGWEEGMGASLREGLSALIPPGDLASFDPLAVGAERGEDAAVSGTLVTLVDTPTLRLETVARIRAAAMAARGVVADADVGGDARHALVQATFDGRPGHPVFLGSAHWHDLRASLHGDSGAKEFLRARGASRVECSDLESGDDVDTMNITQV